MAGSSADGEVNHWPAFVDVLTTVIMVVTFLLVIMSAAVMVLSQRRMEQFKQQLLARQGAAAAHPASGKAQGGRSSDPAKIPIDAPDGSAQAELGDVLRSETAVHGAERLTIRTRETRDTLVIKVKAIEQPENDKGVEVKTRIDAFLKDKATPGATYEIWSFVPQTGSISEAQRVAFYRAAITRNVLIRAGIPPSKILTQARLTDPKAPESHSVRVVVKP